MEDRIACIQNEVKSLAHDELYESAVLLAEVVVSMSKISDGLPPMGAGSHLESLLLTAKVVRGAGNIQRAIEFYKEALGQLNSVSSNTSQKRVLRGSATSEIERLNGEIRFRIGQCQSKIGQKQSAIKTIEHIQNPTCNMHLFLANLYHECGMERPTIGSLRIGVRGNPYAIASVISLLVLGENAPDVAASVSQNANPEDMSWLGPLVEAHGSQALCQSPQAIFAFQKLNQLLPDEPHILTCLASLLMDSNDTVGALNLFKRARVVDPKRLVSMDCLARLYYQKKDMASLNVLARDLMDIDDNRPEPWVALSMFCDFKGDMVLAQQFVNRALEISPLHLYALHLKGHLYLRKNQADMAVSSYMKAYSIQRDIHSYKGLVNAYLTIPKVTEALRLAKEALQLMPKDARAILLVGRVLAHTPGDGKKKASRAYAKALKLNPMCDEAALAFADLFLQQELSDPATELQPAIQLMNQTIQYHSEFYLHSKLGDPFSAAGNLDAALTQYHNALSLNPEYEAAKSGMDRIERLMKGDDLEVDDEYGGL